MHIESDPGSRGMPGLLLGARVRQQATATPAPAPPGRAARFPEGYFSSASPSLINSSGRMGLVDRFFWFPDSGTKSQRL